MTGIRQLMLGHCFDSELQPVHASGRNQVQVCGDSSRRRCVCDKVCNRSVQRSSGSDYVGGRRRCAMTASLLWVCDGRSRTGRRRWCATVVQCSTGRQCVRQLLASFLAHWGSLQIESGIAAAFCRPTQRSADLLNWQFGLAHWLRCLRCCANQVWQSCSQGRAE